MHEAVTIYGDSDQGCFACAPKTMRPAEIIEAVKQKNPRKAGEWSIPQNLVFQGGEKQGCPCEIDSAFRHWFLEAAK
jgi:hypothetical protein